MSRRVVITGMGAVTPLGLGAEDLFRRWAAGECGIEDGVGRCDEFEATDFLSQKEIHRSDRFTRTSAGFSTICMCGKRPGIDRWAFHTAPMAPTA